MRILTFLVLGILVTCCGPQPIIVEPLLADYVKEFELEYWVENNSSVTIVPIEGSHIGRCIKYTDGSRLIEIDSEFFQKNQNNYYVMQQLMYHELGHCVLDLGHNDQLLANGYPVSIMYPWAFGHMYYYEINNDYYVEQLK